MGSDYVLQVFASISALLPISAFASISANNLYKHFSQERIHDVLGDENKQHNAPIWETQNDELCSPDDVEGLEAQAVVDGTRVGALMMSKIFSCGEKNMVLFAWFLKE